MPPLTLQCLMRSGRQHFGKWAFMAREFAARRALPWAPALSPPGPGDEKRLYFPGSSRQLYSEIGTIADSAIVLADSRAGVGVYGPYVDLPNGRWRAAIHFAANCEARGIVIMNVSANAGQRTILSAQFDLATLPKRRYQIGFEFTVDPAAPQVEVRLFCPAGTSATITGVEIAAVGVRSRPGSQPTELQKISSALADIGTRLDRLERLSHGGRATYVGENRVLTKVVVGDIVLGFLAQADDRLIVPYIIVHGEYEPSLTQYFVQNVPRGAHCLDIGANYGYYTCLLASLARQGRTIGVEPDRQVFELVRDNIFINCLEASASAVHAAACDAAGQLTLFRRSTRSGNTSIIRMSGESVHGLGEIAPEPFQVDSLTVDDLLPRFDGRIDFMKVDVEGAEPLVFRGARRTLATNPGLRIVMEWSPHQISAAGFDLGEFINELAALGLQAAVLDTATPTPIALPDLLELQYHSGILLTSRP